MMKGRPLSTTSTNSDLSSGVDSCTSVHTLLARIKKNRVALLELLHGTKGHGSYDDGVFRHYHASYEDGVYRYYHQSFKVYGLQTLTLAIVKALKSLRPGKPLNERFMAMVADKAKIVEDGVGVDPGDGRPTCGCNVLSHVYDVLRKPDPGRGMIAAHEAKFARRAAKNAKNVK